MKNCFTSTSFWVNELETTWFYRIWTFWLRKKVFREKRSTIYNYTAFYDPLVSTENRALSRLKLTNTDDNTALLMRSYHHPHMQKISRGHFIQFFAPELRTEIRYYFASCIFKMCWCQNLHCVSLAIPTRHDGSIEFVLLSFSNSLVSGVTTRHHPWRGRSRTRNARFTPSRSSCFQCSHQLSQGKVIKRHLYFFFYSSTFLDPPLKIFIMLTLIKLFSKSLQRKQRRSKFKFKWSLNRHDEYL